MCTRHGRELELNSNRAGEMLAYPQIASWLIVSQDGKTFGWTATFREEVRPGKWLHCHINCFVEL